LQDTETVLQEFLDNKDYVTGWDNDKNRIMVVKTAKATIKSYDPNFLAKRSALAIEANLRAKSDIIQGFSSSASAENIVNVPGNPIANQLKEEKGRIEQARAEAEQAFLDAKMNAEKIGLAYDKAQSDSLEGTSIGDRAGYLLDAVTKKLDPEYNRDQISEDKKKRLENIKRDLEFAKEQGEAEAKLLEQFEEKMLSLQSDITSETYSSMELLASMPLFGATILKQVESYDKYTGTYSISSLVVWSPKLEKEASDILKQASKGVPKKNKLSLNKWLKKQDLSSMIGPRRYLADNGTINYMGISAVEYDPSKPGTYSRKKSEAELWAKQAAILSLFSAVDSRQKAESLAQTRLDKKGDENTAIFSNLTEKLKESVEGIRISGLEVVRSVKAEHKPSGKTIIVAVANVNSELARKSSKYMESVYATLKEVNEDQSFKKGVEAGMKAEAEKSRNDQRKYDEGYSTGSKSVAAEYDKRTKPKIEETGNKIQSSSQDNSSDRKNNKPQSGVWSGDYEVDDDF
jgi:hypothetical protein